MCVDARAVYDAISATDICEFWESRLKLHLISVRDRVDQGIIRRFYLVDASDVLADGVTKGDVDRTLSHNMSDGCRQGFTRLRSAHQEEQSMVPLPFLPRVSSFPRKRSSYCWVAVVQHNTIINTNNNNHPSVAI